MAIHKILKAQAQGESNKHNLLLDAAANRDSIRQVLKRIASLASTNDRFVFFFAGFSVFSGKVSYQPESMFCHTEG